MEETRKGGQASGPGDSLEEAKERLQQWRGVRKLGEHVPSALWAVAVAAAREHGLHRVAIELRLDYARLKRRVEREGGTVLRGEAASRFVELFAAPTAAGRHECVVELENAGGAKMRVELNGDGLAGLVGLCSVFWGAP